jgi:hypothetical protein
MFERRPLPPSSARAASIDLQRQTEDKARQPETKLGATLQTRRKARLRNAKRSRTKHPKPIEGARDRPASIDIQYIFT